MCAAQVACSWRTSHCDAYHASGKWCQPSWLTKGAELKDASCIGVYLHHLKST
jgi:hypothetical protein